MKKIETKGIKLMQYSHGAGCGCKLSPKELSTILKTSIPQVESKELLVGNDTRDDAAVYDLGDGTGVISTTDFFLPIVDDPFEFGKIAATNAISDIYAMGGKPIMAIAILGWPVNTISSEVANKVVEGGREICRQAGIVLAGGHSIDNPEPIFGLAVTGIVDLKHLKRNDTARSGSKLYLTKPLGIGILSTAEKNGNLKPEHSRVGAESMMKLNDIGAVISKLDSVSALTDVTGFGLLGHLLEICEGSGVNAVIDYAKVPVFNDVDWYVENGDIPGGTKRNWESYGAKIDVADVESKRIILSDAQTSGGLLIAVDTDKADEVEGVLKEAGLFAESIGYLSEFDNDKRIKVI
ncbi:MAG: selenide, water dikinase SelD [Ichthyobacteriaceae bacterium]|nr:selenide, water dikinase SelD [Ichthyobacteriaceae bacterium]